MTKATLGVIVGNRDFFPDRLISEGRSDILGLFREMDIEPIILEETDTKLGSVETYAHAKACAELFRQHADRIEGILVTLPNFGDEKGVADTIKLSGLNVPILVQAYPDDLSQLNVERRRDAYCGKISVCNNLRQYGFSYTLTERHTVHPCSDGFKTDLRKFLGVCKVVKGLRNARLRRSRGAAQRLQHRALQREAAPDARHQRRHSRFLRDPGVGQPAG
jgi:L-fucose isomerase-like protein